MFELDDPLLTLVQVASTLRVSVVTLRGWRKQGKLHCIQLPGGSLRVKQSELDRIMSNTSGGHAQ